MPLVHLAPFHDIAGKVAERLSTGDEVEVLVASSGIANAIAGELIRQKPNGVAGLRLETIETFARRIVNAAGEFPRVAGDEERRLAMRGESTTR
jgi:hypothetical protein